ncbi:hypothetical protein E2C01_056816 [Portunus trituberculatus]|uniref:Uncharacterized protein n=1 Tax=Portunus trituberculatus TaxID=210409 RepID=A0A5B7GYR0_PORTR|nr:hypothetical protein [Portunus trituberculatus]
MFRELCPLSMQRAAAAAHFLSGVQPHPSYRHESGRADWAIKTATQIRPYFLAVDNGGGESEPHARRPSPRPRLASCLPLTRGCEDRLLLLVMKTACQITRT